MLKTRPPTLPICTVVPPVCATAVVVAKLPSAPPATSRRTEESELGAPAEFELIVSVLADCGNVAEPGGGQLKACAPLSSRPPRWPLCRSWGPRQQPGPAVRWLRSFYGSSIGIIPMDLNNPASTRLHLCGIGSFPAEESADFADHPICRAIGALRIHRPAAAFA